MKKLLISFFLLSFIACQQTAEVSRNNPPALTKAEAEEIAKDLIQGAFDDIWSAMDSAKIWKYHTNDFLICENGIVWNNDSIVNYQNSVKQQGSIPVRKNRFDFFKVEHTDDVIWMAYHNYASITPENGPASNYSWLESAVAIKKNDEWKIQIMHSTFNGNR